MTASVISYHEDFLELCDHIREAGEVAFDTEFVSESTYRPELGLLQFATRQRAVAVDPLTVGDLSAWWDIMADDTTSVIVHGGQAEIRFCLQLTGRRPLKLVDIQLAEGFRSRSYPLSYSAIVQRVLNQNVDGSQTRTDWMRRPLSADQIRYAVEDVEHVLRIWDCQRKWLEQHNRLEWAESEFQRMIDDIQGEESVSPWERLSGIHRMSRRELAVVQKLALWREQEAAYRNRPVRRVLRDDLLLDLAKRKPLTAKQALATRDMNRPEYRKRIDGIVAAVQEACDLPESGLPRKVRSRRQESSSDEQVISKLLSLSLANRCAELDISQMIVANNRDLAELVRYHRLGEKNGTVPRILTGWRKEVCGKLMIDVMDGRTGFRVSPPGSDTPLVFETTGFHAGKAAKQPN